MHVPVGPHWYELILEPDYIDSGGEAVLGLCDPDRQQIRISAVAPPAKRLSLLWHELAHAWVRELDVHERPSYADEPLANLIGLAMARMTPRLLARIHIYLTDGIDADGVLDAPGLPGPVPVVRLSS